MPVRSLSSSVLTWPDAPTVDRALRRWAEGVGCRHPGVLRIGYFGSYARGDWGVGSDLDLIVIVASSDRPFVRRAAEWDTTDLPVPADVFIYTQEEWQHLEERGWMPAIRSEAIWVWERAAEPDRRQSN